jgi:Neurotransmitter-gated ion-channel ligand binding domain/Neurotransmitter-gated ion-channel transmembrane region
LAASPEQTSALIHIAQNHPAPQSQPKEEDPEDLKYPPRRTEPIKISIGLHVSNLADIEQASEIYGMAGYLLYSWRDPRLAYNPQPTPARNKVVSLEQIWHPALEMVNFKSSNSSETSAEILPDGTVVAQERFSRTLSSGLDLRHFPFDQQRLQVVLESLKYGDNTVVLGADPSKISIGTDSFVSLSEWQIGSIQGRNGKSFFPPEQQHYSRVTIEVQVKRNFGFYLFKIMLPLLLITIASWSVFWIEPQEFSTQITIAFTNLLTVVALLLVINDSLPRVGYLTLMDGFTMLCFLTILIAILELVFTHRLQAGGNSQQALKIHHLARWIFPTFFIFANLMLSGIMKMGKG